MHRSSLYPRLLSAAGLAAFALLVTAGLRGENQSFALPTPQPKPAPPVRSGADNPAVEPGRVAWHPSFESARAASKASGKPVLLLHMMGRLDRQFC
jgi:hypothetical protein